MPYEIEVRHDGLHKYQVIRAKEYREAKEKAEAKIRAWEKQWERKLEVQRKKEESLRAQEYKEARKAEAEKITAEAEEIRRSLERLLKEALGADHTVHWDGLMDSSPFPESPPPKPGSPPKPTKPQRVIPMRRESKPGFFRTILERVSPGYAEVRSAKEEIDHRNRVQAAKQDYREAVELYNEEARRYNEQLRETRAKWKNDLAAWEGREGRFRGAQLEKNSRILDLQRRYQEKDEEAVCYYCELVLQKSQYPDFFRGNFALDYNAENGILIVDFELPIPE